MVVPVKRLINAKSRLDSADNAVRSQLAIAFAKDVVAAALATPNVAQVLVVAADESVFQAAEELGAQWLRERPDVAPGAASALNQAIRLGGEHLGSGAVAALAGDLPALRPRELEVALDWANNNSRCFVSDHHGTGTTLLTAVPGGKLRPHFGGASARAHRDSGALDITDHAGASLRLDVDTTQDLNAAKALGLGKFAIQLTDLMPTGSRTV